MYSLRSVSVSVSRLATSFARLSGGSWAKTKGAKRPNVKMRAMLNPPEKSRSAGFLAALAIGWLVLAAAGMVYARSKNIPGWVATPLLGAFLAEYPFYLVLAFPTLRERFAGGRLPAFLLVAAVLPYLICSTGAVQ